MNSSKNLKMMVAGVLAPPLLFFNGGARWIEFRLDRWNGMMV
jgi:hypothetical protein